MKRGNTALKRGVGLASAFALAVAGAVIAAPAASAAVTDISGSLTDSIRATPIADARLIDGDALISAAGDLGADTAVYDATTTTGAVSVIGVGKGQAVSDFQVIIQPADNTAAFAKDQGFTVELSDESTFASANVSISAKPVRIAGNDFDTAVRALDGVTGVKNATKYMGYEQGTEATPLAAAAELTNPARTVSASVTDDGDLQVVFNANDNNAAVNDNDYAYLLNFTGVKVDVTNRVAAGALSAEITGTGDTTTLAYVSPFEISTVGEASYPTTVKGSIPLPDVKISETSVNAFANAGQDVFVAVDGTRAADSTPLTFAAVAKATPSKQLALGAAGAAGAEGATSLASSDTQQSLLTRGDNSRIDSVVLSDLEADGAKVGQDITLTVVGDLGSAASDSAFSFSAAAPADGASVTISADADSQRLSGKNRFDTASIIAKNYAKAINTGLESVILANGLDAKQGIDALAASFLSGAVDAPVLLTSSADALPAETADALKTVFEDSAGDSKGNITVYVLGKTDSVSAAAAEEAQTVIKDAANSGLNDVNIVRLDGDNRYQTAAKVAVAGDDEGGLRSLSIDGGTAYNTAFLASGQVNADALAAGVLSVQGGIPVLLNDGDTVNEDTAKAIKDLNIQQIVVLGGTDRVSADVVGSLKDDLGVKNVVRINGSGTYGRYNTAALLAQFGIDNNISSPGASNVYVANGADGFADALAVGPYAGLGDNFVVTVPTALLPDLTRGFLNTNKAGIDLVTAVGGVDRVPASVIKAAEGAVGL